MEYMRWQHRCWSRGIPKGWQARLTLLRQNISITEITDIYQHRLKKLTCLILRLDIQDKNKAHHAGNAGTNSTWSAWTTSLRQVVINSQCTHTKSDPQTPFLRTSNLEFSHNWDRDEKDEDQHYHADAAGYGVIFIGMNAMSASFASPIPKIFNRSALEC